MSNVTLILSQLETGDPAAAEQLFQVVYDELRRLARAKVAQEKPGQTLQATALVHEAYLRLLNVDQSQHWDSRGHFFAAAAEAMRRILVEQARRHQSLKHGGLVSRQPLDPETMVGSESSADLLALDEALDRLATQDATAAELVKLRYFSGLTVAQAAAVLDVLPRTADRLWVYAKAWLYRDLAGPQTESDENG